MDPRLKRVTAAAVLAGVAVGALAVVVLGGRDPSRSSDPLPGGATGQGSSIPDPAADADGYIPDTIATVGDGGCTIFPRDNVWHSVVAGDAVALADPSDPAARMVAGAGAPVRAAFGADSGEGLNIVPSDGSGPATFRVASNWLAPGNLNHARSSDADDAGLEALGVPWFTMELQAPPPGQLRWSQMSLDPSTDNRLYILDTDECTSAEFIGFNGLLMAASGRLEANRLSMFDLRSNNRRLSRTWGEGPCPEVPANPVFDPGCDGTTEKPASARGGSGLSGLGGLIRVAEVLEAGEIDHAISAVLPKNLVSADRSVWPATVTDGTGGADTFADAPEGAGPVPMGARLRLRGDFELGCDAQQCPQATTIVAALKRHGAIIVDSMGPAESLSEGAMHLIGEMSPEWDPADLRSIVSPPDGTPGMVLADFELVDAEDMRALPDAGPQDDDWLRVA